MDSFWNILLTIIGTVASIAGAIIAVWQANKSKKEASKAEMYAKKFFDNGNLDKLSAISTQLKDIHDKALELKNSRRETQGANTNQVKRYKLMQKSLHDILHFIPTNYDNLTEQLNFAMKLLSDCIQNKKPTNDETFHNFEGYIYSAARVTKKELEDIKGL